MASHRAWFSTELLPIQLSVLGLVALSFVALSILPGRVVVVPGLVSVAPAEGLVFPAVILLGSIGAFGAALGYVLADGLTGAVGAMTVVGALGQLALGYVGADLWRRYGSSPAAVTDARDVVVFGVSALVGSITAIAFVGWVGAALGQMPFFVAVFSLPGMFVASLVIGLPVLLFTPRLRAFLPDGVELPRSPSLARPSVLVPIVIGWGTVASIVSVGFQMFATVPASGVRSYGLGVLLVFRNGPLIGANVATIQAIIGGIALIGLGVVSLDDRLLSDN